MGIRALAVTLITYHDKRRAKDGSNIDTIREVIERWAPPNENNTSAYVNEVSKAVGVTPDMIIDLHDYDTLRPLVEAIIRHENGRGPLKTPNTWYAAEVIEEGLRRAGVVKPIKTVKAVPRDQRNGWRNCHGRYWAGAAGRRNAPSVCGDG